MGPVLVPVADDAFVAVDCWRPRPPRGSSVAAFFLTVVSFTANGKTSALTMTVAANVKQVLVIGLSIVVFAVPVTLLNATGVLITLAGGALYTFAELQERRHKVAR